MSYNNGCSNFHDIAGCPSFKLAFRDKSKYFSNNSDIFKEDCQADIACFKFALLS